jgi:ABC-type branched-subunit amino acid transport system substrate-binding protein
MKTKIILGIAILILILLALLGIGRTDKKDNLIKIGSVEALSGFASFWGEPSKIGMELAVEDLRKKGINVEVIYEDSEGKPDKAVSAAQKLINIDKVDVLFTDFSGPSSAVSPIALENKILYGYSSFDSQIVKSNPYAIKTFFDSTYECKVTSEYAKNNLGIDKIAYIGVKLSFTDACVEEMIKVFGKDNVIVEAAAKTTETDFRASLLKLKQNGIKLAISYGYEGNYEAIFQQNIELNSGVALVCIESDCYSEKIKSKIPLTALEGSILFDFKTPTEFKDRIKEKYGESINVRSAALSYDLTNYMVEAVLACGDDVICQIDHIQNNKSIKSVIDGSNYGGDRVFDLENEYFMVKNGKLEKIDIK